jgi:hypothetical protein
MSITADRFAYFRSLADEIRSQSKRVRDLIGSRHWLSDGHQKEYLLTSLLVRHLPSNMLVSRGFVADPRDSSQISDEQDILIVDTSVQGPLFNQGGMVVALPNTVIASISVKSEMSSASIKQTVKNQNTVRNVLLRCGHRTEPVWCAGYFFEVNQSLREHPSNLYGNYKEAAEASTVVSPRFGSSMSRFPGPNVMVASDDLAYVVQADAAGVNGVTNAKILGYKCDGLATAVFLAHLIDHAAVWRRAGWAELSDLVDHEDFSPIEPDSSSFAF